MACRGVTDTVSSSWMTRFAQTYSLSLRAPRKLEQTRTKVSGESIAGYFQRLELEKERDPAVLVCIRNLYSDYSLHI